MLLAKAWGLYESKALTFGRGEVLNSAQGRLSTAAFNCVMLAVFNQHAHEIIHPMQALALFFLDLRVQDGLMLLLRPLQVFVLLLDVCRCQAQVFCIMNCNSF